MSDQQEDKTKGKKLTLNKKKLSFNKSSANAASARPLTRTLRSGGGQTIVEVQGKSSADATKNLSAGDLKSRLSLIKKASIASKEKTPRLAANLAEKAAAEKKEASDTAPQEPSSQIAAPPVDLPKPQNNTSKHEAKKTKDEEYIKRKPKSELATKKMKKSDIIGMLDSDGATKSRSIASLKRAQAKRKGISTAKKIYREIIITGQITAANLAEKLSERSANIISELKKLGISAGDSYLMDADTAELVATSMGHKAKIDIAVSVEQSLDQQSADEKLELRPPVVTVMGHVDHGKTSLLDALRTTDITSGEAGGITQHVGAYNVKLQDGKSISFIDTPGHEAFSQMRMRGAAATDIVVLVVAANDGVKAQTIEAISHAKASKVPIIVAVNKIDLPEANIERVKNELLVHDVIADDLGGDVIFVPISAKEKTNLDKLEEAILLQAELMDLKAPTSGLAAGVVIEAKTDQFIGSMTTLLVQRGKIKKGDIVLAGSTFGKVRKMIDDKAAELKLATPSIPVVIQGLADAPRAGDKFHVVESEKKAREVIEYRQRKEKEEKASARRKMQMENMFAGKNATEVNVIIKGDSHGSVEAICHSLEKIPSDEVKVKIVHQGVGAISESDVLLASTTGSAIFGFNVRAGAKAQGAATANKLVIRYYSIIYQLIDDVRQMLTDMLAPKMRESYIGSAEIKQIFDITKIGKIAGSQVTKGMIKKGAGVRLLRDNVVIHEGKLKTLKRFKDDVQEVREGFECGIAFEKYQDIQEGDQLEVFEIIEEKREL